MVKGEPEEVYFEREANETISKPPTEITTNPEVSTRREESREEGPMKIEERGTTDR